ncbi:unnamed protein product [Rotaria sp. Silwood2]|nr:unnamed protein product [Rotaria sp. Silwood2]
MANTNSRRYPPYMIWSNNKCHSQDTIINKTCHNPKEFTCIIFTSDLNRFQMDKFDDDDLVSLFKRCAYNVVMSAGCNVTPNVNDCWDIGVAKNDYNNDFQQTNFVNSILTSEHDKHIDYITEQICPKLVEHIKKKSKAAAAENLKPMQVENHFFICVSCLIEYAEFESQAKQNKLATEGKHFCSTFPLKDDKKFFLKVL